MVRLYDRHFIESQEAYSITTIGQFRFLNDPSIFFWLRGFDSIDARPIDLNAFYHGATWQSLRGKANALLLDTDNVLLLEPAHEGAGFSLPLIPPSALSQPKPRGLLVFTMYYLGSDTGPQFDRMFEASIRPVMQDRGARIIATFITDPSPNNYPRLVVRSDANVFAWFACFSNEDSYNRYETALRADPRWWKIQGNLALAHMYVPADVHLLVPTPRSALRCSR